MVPAIWAKFRKQSHIIKYSHRTLKKVASTKENKTKQLPMGPS
jgi:hypothetical protein